MDRTSPSPAIPQQIRLALLVFAGFVALLGAGYYFFLRTDYSVLFTELRPADASAIVAELESRSVPHELRDGGATIAVPADQAASARLAIAGSDVAARGMVGFELFNESDMGLTDFAQKVNYQRALQGELARTIMMMDGVDSARVHLAIPERALFRGARSEPKAAVTVLTRRGRTLDEVRVLGIQRLVAAAVTDLSLADVVVLDDRGRVISPSAAADLALPPALEEQSAVQQYYRARTRAAIENVLPGLEFDVRVAAVSDGGASAAAPAEGAARDFRLRIVVATAALLNADDQASAANAVGGAVALDPAAGDSLSFIVAPVGAGAAAAPPAAAFAEPVMPPSPSSASAASEGWSSIWWAVVAGLLGLAAIGALARPGRPSMSAEEREAFVRRIRAQLDPETGNAGT